MKREQRLAIIEAFAAQGIEALHGKGGFFLRGQGFVTFAQARKMTAVAVPAELKREGGMVSAYGDYAIIAKINGIR